MAFVKVIDPKDVGYVRLAKTAETAVSVGDVLAWDIANNALERATSATSTLLIYGVAMENRAESDTDVLVAPLSEDQIWLADLANDSSTSQVGHRCDLTDHATLNNSGTDVTGNTGVFQILAVVGSATDKKALARPRLAVPVE